MSLNYGQHTSVVLLGTKSGTTPTAVTLTTSYADNTKTFDVGGYAKLDFDVIYTTGAAETNNTCDIKVEASIDGVNFYQLVNESASSGTSTLYQREFVFTGASAATAYSYAFGLDVFYKKIKVSAKEGGVSSVHGTIFLEGLLSGN